MNIVSYKTLTVNENSKWYRLSPSSPLTSWKSQAFSHEQRPLLYSAGSSLCSKFFRNRYVLLSQRMDLSLGDDGSCTWPLSSWVMLHACKRVLPLIFHRTAVGHTDICEQGNTVTANRHITIRHFPFDHRLPRPLRTNRCGIKSHKCQYKHNSKQIFSYLLSYYNLLFVSEFK